MFLEERVSIVQAICNRKKFDKRLIGRLLEKQTEGRLVHRGIGRDLLEGYLTVVILDDVLVNGLQALLVLMDPGSAEFPGPDGAVMPVLSDQEKQLQQRHELFGVGAAFEARQ